MVADSTLGPFDPSQARSGGRIPLCLRIAVPLGGEPMRIAYRLAAATLALAFSGAALAQNAICYNCPPEWADWGTQLRKIKEKTGVTVPQDNKNSGQSLAQLVAEKASPVADITYLGVTFGIQAKKEGVTAPYKV